MDFSGILLLSCLILIVAILYSSVGHGGASGYLAVLSFFAFSTQEMATTALILNILVSGISFYSYMKAGHFSFSFTLPFIVASIPFAFIGGMLQVTNKLYFFLLTLVLLVAAFRMAISLKEDINKDIKPPSKFPAFMSGSSIGLLSGIVGVGGGIFLSPFIILMKWANPKVTAGTSAFFILANSISGLTGRFIAGHAEVGSLFPLVIASFIGGLVGSHLGANIFTSLTIRRLLAIVLVIASIKALIRFLGI
ncbi:MAG: sulfite exporter TauE/SafE family protein [Candidatus Melainabacteria bacterium]|nr:sulfite exporter TauE/SafE family protein [Candidatus Melainabacteria bacterium]MBI3309447.1 sulfite exporter TauE/SafE family protein [Candidatus Melainabacteria bacterium]